MEPANLRALLETSLPAARRELLARVGRIAEAKGLPVYLAGGPVRDLLLGLPPGDFDLVVDGDAPALARAVARELGGEVTVHTPFGTATWTGAAGAVDFATARTETYPQPAALPAVSPAPIVDDLRRRDFTINAMALRVDGERFGDLLDPHGGQADLAAGRVRVLHLLSFVDDPTRLFRAVRYEQRLGFQLAPATLALIPGAWEALSALTGDRARHELEVIFREPRASAMLLRLDGLGVLRHVHPALRWDAEASRRAEALGQLPAAEWKLAAPPEPDAFFFAFLLARASDAEAPAALARLNAGREATEAVLPALKVRPGWVRPSDAVAALDRLSELAVITAWALRDRSPELHEYLARWRFVRAATTGDDLVTLGLTPGPKFKLWLWRLRAARLDGEVTDPAGERELLRILLEAAPAAGGDAEAGA